MSELGYNYNLGSRVLIGRPKSTNTTPELSSFARVVDVLLDNTREWINEELGEKYPIGTIKCIRLNQNNEATDVEVYAYPSSVGTAHIPHPPEIVGLEHKPISDSQFDSTWEALYYTDVVNLWGSPNNNALPATNFDGQNLLGKDVPTLSDINPLYPFPGDILTEGRQGQSIRIGGFKSAENKLVDDSNNGKPYILISNGQIKTDNGVDHIVEDINKDPNSIYLLSDHQTELVAANLKRDSYDAVPLTSNQYKGNQVIINGGRLYFNAKEDSAFISAKESIGLNARTLNLDAKDYICLDASKIYLGKGARTAKFTKEPVVLGVQLENWLNSLLDSLGRLSRALSTASSVSGGPVTQLNAAGPALQATVTSLRTQIKQFQSKKVYTE